MMSEIKLKTHVLCRHAWEFDPSGMFYSKHQLNPQGFHNFSPDSSFMAQASLLVILPKAKN